MIWYSLDHWVSVHKLWEAFLLISKWVTWCRGRAPPSLWFHATFGCFVILIGNFNGNVGTSVFNETCKLFSVFSCFLCACVRERNLTCSLFKWTMVINKYQSYTIQCELHSPKKEEMLTYHSQDPTCGITMCMLLLLPLFHFKKVLTKQ